MTTRHEAFTRYRPRKNDDPSPHELTPAERELIERCFQSGRVPPARLVRKLLRLSDERLARIIELERIAFPLVERSK